MFIHGVSNKSNPRSSTRTILVGLSNSNNVSSVVDIYRHSWPSPAGTWIVFTRARIDVDTRDLLGHVEVNAVDLGLLRSLFGDIEQAGYARAQKGSVICDVVGVCVFPAVARNLFWPTLMCDCFNISKNDANFKDDSSLSTMSNLQQSFFQAIKIVLSTHI